MTKQEDKLFGAKILGIASGVRRVVLFGNQRIAEAIEESPYDEYELEFDGDCLTDDCVSDVFTLPQKNDLVSCAWQILNGIPDKILNNNGEPMQGVALEVIGKKRQSG